MSLRMEVPLVSFNNTQLSPLHPPPYKKQPSTGNVGLPQLSDQYSKPPHTPLHHYDIIVI